MTNDRSTAGQSSSIDLFEIHDTSFHRQQAVMFFATSNRRALWVGGRTGPGAEVPE